MPCIKENSNYQFFGMLRSLLSMLNHKGIESKCKYIETKREATTKVSPPMARPLIYFFSLMARPLPPHFFAVYLGCLLLRMRKYFIHENREY